MTGVRARWTTGALATMGAIVVATAVAVLLGGCPDRRPPAKGAAKARPARVERPSPRRHEKHEHGHGGHPHGGGAHHHHPHPHPHLDGPDGHHHPF